MNTLYALGYTGGAAIAAMLVYLCCMAFLEALSELRRYKEPRSLFSAMFVVFFVLPILGTLFHLMSYNAAVCFMVPWEPKP